MKKFILILLVISICAISAFTIPDLIVAMVPKSDITNIKSIEYTKSVTATGEIQERNKISIATDVPFIVSRVCISEGQHVKKGDTLLIVDRDATAEKLIEMAKYTDITGINSQYANLGFSELYDSIPSEIICSMDGNIDTLNIKAGSFVNKDGIIASYSGTGELYVSVQVPESKVIGISSGQEVEITGSGFKDITYHGKVTRISPTASKVYIGSNQETVVTIEVSIDDADDKIKAGYTIKAKIMVGDTKNVSVIPYETVLQDENGDEFVYVFSEGHAVKTYIETGLELTEGIEVINGINTDDAIIYTPTVIEEDGALIKIEEQVE